LREADRATAAAAEIGWSGDQSDVDEVAKQGAGCK
jgi:hypothetical protein